MSEDPQIEADRRFSERLEATGARDPREYYRAMLRELRGAREEHYQEMVARYRDEVVRPVADEEADPLETWLTFGLALARASVGDGRTVVIDGEGRATPLEGPPRWDQMVLHLPDERGVRAVPVSLPPEPSPPQRATVDLLVHGKVRLASD